MENWPWYAILIVVTVIAIAIITAIVILVKNNKNIQANTDIKGNKIGINISDSDVPKNENDYETLLYQRLARLKIHPLFSTVFPHTIYKDSSLDSIHKLIRSYNKNYSRQLLNDVLAMSQLIKKYIVSYKFYSENIIKFLEEDITSKDKNYKGFLRVLKSFISDVENEVNLKATIDNVKTTGFEDENGTKVDANKISMYVFTEFSKAVKLKTPDFLRDLLIARTYMFTQNENDFERNFTLVTSTAQLYDSILEYVYSIYVDIRYDLILSVCESYEHDEEIQEVLEEID